MAASTRSNVLSLYKQLLKEGNKVTDYNFRNYFVRRTRDAFKENKSLTDSNQIEKCVLKAQNDLAVLKRQATMSQLFGSGKLIIESQAR